MKDWCQNEKPSLVTQDSWVSILLKTFHLGSFPSRLTAFLSPPCLALLRAGFWPTVWLLERLLTGVTTGRLSQFSLLSTRSHYLLLHKETTALLPMHCTYKSKSKYKYKYKLDVVQLCETQMFKFVLCEAVNISSFSASWKTMKTNEKLWKTMKNYEKQWKTRWET